jgi:hypothetical protein
MLHMLNALYLSDEKVAVLPKSGSVSCLLHKLLKYKIKLASLKSDHFKRLLRIGNANALEGYGPEGLTAIVGNTILRWVIRWRES